MGKIWHILGGLEYHHSGLAVVRINIRLRGRDVSLAHNPLPLTSLYWRVLHDWTEDKSAPLEVWCFSKLSGEGKQLQKKGSIKFWKTEKQILH